MTHPTELRELRRDSCGKAFWYYRIPCEECGKVRWVSRKYWLRGRCRTCHSCTARAKIRLYNTSGAARLCGCRHPAFKRGYVLSDSGYQIITLPVGHPYLAMASPHRRVRRHRLIMAESLGRLLSPWEQVHHRNGNRQDNRLENLELLDPRAHTRLTGLETRIKQLEELCLIQASLLAKVGGK
jgi:hypothetical protein